MQQDGLPSFARPSADGRAANYTQIAIIGSGFSGLGAAAQLRRAHFDDFVIFERASELGGTWRDNSYPGCACDVESHLYSFSFAPNPGWSRTFSRQPEILAYLQRCADTFGLRPHVRFQHELLTASWDEQQRVWQLQTSQGAFTASILIGGMGALSEPAFPELRGLSRFQGKTFHSAQWDHAYDLTDRKVAVIGTGASAVQFVPEIQPKVKQLTLFQRTPAWVLPRLDRPISRLEQGLFSRLPPLRALVRAGIYARREAFVLVFRHPRVAHLVEPLAKRYLAATISDPALREKLTPNFRLGCKRVLVSSDYLPALARDNVQVVSRPIREVTARGIVTSDGVEHDFDAIIFGTGFHVTDMPFGERIRGRAGRTLNESWNGSPQAHLGTTVSGFPNLFLLLGPNTALGHTSVVLMIEAQIELVLRALEHMRARDLDCIETKPEAQARSVGEVDRDMEGTVWTAGGCNSWYLDRTGRNSTLWPSYTFSFMRRARFRPADYAWASSST